MAKIKKILAQEILDSRGNPTIQATIFLDDGNYGKASVPAGASLGKYEAKELRDKDRRFNGKGVKKTCENINKIIYSALKGQLIGDQKKLDKLLIELDGTKDKSRLGANAILATSLAYSRASANSLNISLYQYIRDITKEIGFITKPKFPYPMFNILNGGIHASNNVDIQEFIIIPQFPDYQKNLQAGIKIYNSLAKILKSLNLPTLVGDEGGFAPDLKSHNEGLELLKDAVEKTEYKLGKEIFLGIDVAASRLLQKENKNYFFSLEKVSLSSHQLTFLYQEWQKKYSLFSVEDGVAEDDFEGWKHLTQKLKDKLMLVGDDLFVTNLQRVKMGIKRGLANAILIKPNQIGTLTETLEVCKTAQKAGYRLIVSHRSGETTDSFIADLSYGIGADFIKAGAPARGERVAKYNRLLEIYFDTSKKNNIIK